MLPAFGMWDEGLWWVDEVGREGGGGSVFGKGGVRAEASHRARSQPLSLYMWASSMMNLPSLYFWLFSKACSWNGDE